MRTLLILPIILLSLTLAGQTPNQELGLRFTGLDSYSLLYKRQLDYDVFRRYSFAFANVGFATSVVEESFSQGNIGFGLRVGREHRKPIADKLLLLTGWQPGITVIANFGEVDQVSIVPSVAYLLGCVYQVSDRFYVGIEILPSASLALTAGDAPTTLAFNAGFSTAGVGLTAVYTFTPAGN